MRQDLYVQLAQDTTLPGGAAGEPYFTYLHDGLKHGGFGIRDSRRKVFSSTGAAGPPVAAGVLINGSRTEDLRAWLGVGDVIYTRVGVNVRENDLLAASGAAAFQRTQWIPRTITAIDAAKATVNKAIYIPADTPLFYRKLQSVPAANLDGWIGIENAQEVSIQFFVVSGGPITAFYQVSNAENAPSDTEPDVPVQLSSLAIAAGAGNMFRYQGGAKKIRVGFQGAGVVTASLFARRGL